ncbi:malto-oligosyltrehalose synthase [Limimaricola sp. G21655-S1]|uniref:malto-oligosyltrehalose synthase n=1 Tax=Limimaricola sp. G21655-S1 TaxID=3014768 RepID=UPI0022B000AD|nr:malto-oligosyltrehalose synthase [Limimaricola sp. G21655-S1]MCZ4262627.1 malto-oligosyltrehalose synthase [Limimaricola sp. G21655-S1]
MNAAPLPRATYRLQLREGVDFDTARRLVPYLAGLGISHLYLSPIFTAASGSTHGYDVTNPAEIDPCLGGRAGFEALAEAARAAGLGVILDIVPNHTAFHLENPWLRDVLRHGQDSRYARHFDIDWAKGRLVLPFLGQPFDEMLEAGAFRLEEGDEGPQLATEHFAVPMSQGTLPSEEMRRDPEAIRDAHAAQPWRLTHWEYERDGVTHRRFFNVTGLIGMRVEDEAVFEEMHALLFELLDKDLVQGIRLDHIDGLADPAAYLRRLRERVGDTPIWIEKILTGDETVPASWPIQGTTGYEAARAISRILTDAEGLARLDESWRRETGREGSFHDALKTAKHEVIRQELAAELHQLIDMARSAVGPEDSLETGDEALREAIIALLVAFPRYRTYFAEGEAPSDEERALMDSVTAEAGEGLRTDATVKRIAGFITDPETPEERALQVRFQQVTGALLAKAHEDTAGFRWNRYIAANEVGADPDESTITPEELSGWLQRRAPTEMTLTSTHDTKRSEDARMRLVAISHLPEAFLALWEHSEDVDGAHDIDPNLRWYILQTLLAMWEAGRGDIAERLGQHVEKAMREAKEVTTWTHQNQEAEADAQRFAKALAQSWEGELPAGAGQLMARGEVLSLAQTGLKLVMPGIPDIYQGTELGAFQLTDPDNRMAVDFRAVADLAIRGAPDCFERELSLDEIPGAAATDGPDPEPAPDLDSFAGRKARLICHGLALRRRMPGFFEQSETRFETSGDGHLVLTRQSGEGRLELRIDRQGHGLPEAAREAERIWPRHEADLDAPVCLDWVAAAG